MKRSLRNSLVVASLGVPVFLLFTNMGIVEELPSSQICDVVDENYQINIPGLSGNTELITSSLSEQYLLTSSFGQSLIARVDNRGISEVYRGSDRPSEVFAVNPIRDGFAFFGSDAGGIYDFFPTKGGVKRLSLEGSIWRPKLLHYDSVGNLLAISVDRNTQKANVKLYGRSGWTNLFKTQWIEEDSFAYTTRYPKDKKNNLFIPYIRTGRSGASLSGFMLQGDGSLSAVSFPDKVLPQLPSGRSWSYYSSDLSNGDLYVSLAAGGGGAHISPMVFKLNVESLQSDRKIRPEFMEVSIPPGVISSNGIRFLKDSNGQQFITYTAYQGSLGYNGIAENRSGQLVEIADDLSPVGNNSYISYSQKLNQVVHYEDLLDYKPYMEAMLQMPNVRLFFNNFGEIYLKNSAGNTNGNPNFFSYSCSLRKEWLLD